jgi:uncharacterized membrane protein (DUF373 family)
MDKPPVRPAAPSTLTRPPGHNTRDLGDGHEEPLPPVVEDGLIKVLHGIIHAAVRVLAILMTLVIVWGTADVVYIIYRRAIAEPFYLLSVADILVIFGAFMVVLISIEIFINIALYIKRDVLPLKLVIATALMAISRKVIMLDFKDLEPTYIIAMATVILALGTTYWLISYKPQVIKQQEER